MGLSILLLLVGVALGVALGIGLTRTFSHRAIAPESVISAEKVRPTPIKGHAADLARPVTAATVHDWQTPIRMILGYCDFLLRPAHERQPLPLHLREDVASIERNARQLQTLIDQQFVNAPPASLPTDGSAAKAAKDCEPETAGKGSRQTIIVFHSDPLAAESLRRHLPGYEVTWIPTTEALGRSLLPGLPVALVVTALNESRHAEIAAIVGDSVPMLAMALPDTQEAGQLARNVYHITKPVTYEALAIALAGADVPVREVLIIDDNQDNADLIGRMLTSINVGCTIWKAYSGREGLAFMREHVPGMVILDVHLPDISGLTIVRSMRTTPQLTSIPVLFISAGHPSDQPAVVLPTLLSIRRLSGFSTDDLGRLLEALIPPPISTNA